MKVFSYFILCLIVFSQTIDCLNTIKIDQHIAMERLKKDPLLEISITESLLESSQQTNATKNLQFFLLKSASRHKNKAYSKLLKSYQKLVNTLIQKLIIGDQRLFIKSKIKQKYIRKKKIWQFGIMFMMQGQDAQLDQCYHDIKKFGVVKIDSKGYTTSLNERIIASNAFYKLKQKVLSQLSRMPGLAIQQVQKVEIKGFSIPNSISLQRKQNWPSVEDIKEDKNQEMSYLTDFFFSKAEVSHGTKSVTIKAIFRIGQESQINIDQDDDESQESQFESESDDDEERYNSRELQEE